MYRIYNVIKKDLQGISTLLNKCNLDFKRKVSNLEKAHKISDVFLVCKDKNNIIGTVRAIFDGYYCMLFDLAVDSRFRKQNIEKLLMEEVEKKLKKQGAKFVFLNSSDEAVKFYKKLGYIKPKTNPFIKYLNRKRRR